MTKKIEGTEENWESGELGRSKDYAVRSTTTSQEAMDAACDLKAISIRLEEDLIDDLKGFAEFEGIGYQPLIRKILHRFVEGETKRHMRMHASFERKKLLEEAEAESTSKASPARKRA